MKIFGTHTPSLFHSLAIGVCGLWSGGEVPKSYREKREQYIHMHESVEQLCLCLCGVCIIGYTVIQK